MPATKEELAVFQASLLSFPDFVIQIGHYKWHVHSTVISRASKFFNRACNGSFKESNEKLITLHDDCPWIVARMVRWLYYGDQVIPSLFNNSSDNSAVDMMMRQQQQQQQQDCGVTNAATVMAFPDDHQELWVRDSQRETWVVQALLYQIADKYEIADLTDVTRIYLANSVTRSPSLLRALVDFLDVSSLQRDHDLTRRLLKAVLCQQSTESAIAYAEVKSLLGHDADIMDTAHGVLVEELDSRTNRLRLSQDYNRQFLSYIDQAHTALSGGGGSSSNTNSFSWNPYPHNYLSPLTSNLLSAGSTTATITSNAVSNPTRSVPTTSSLPLLSASSTTIQPTTTTAAATANTTTLPTTAATTASSAPRAPTITTATTTTMPNDAATTTTNTRNAYAFIRSPTTLMNSSNSSSSLSLAAGTPESKLERARHILETARSNRADVLKLVD